MTDRQHALRRTHPRRAGIRTPPLRNGAPRVREHRFCTPVVHELPRRRNPDPPGAAGW